MHQPGANHAPRASVTQVNHSVHTLSTFLRIRADPSMQIFIIIIIITIIIIIIIIDLCGLGVSLLASVSGFAVLFELKRCNVCEVFRPRSIY